MAEQARDDPLMTLDAISNLYGIPEPELVALSRRRTIPPIKNGRLPLIETTRRYTASLRDRLLTRAEAAQALGKSEAWTRKLIAQGYIKKQSDGRCRLEDVFLGYIAFLTDEARRATKVQAESRVRDARAREIELRIAEREGRLIQVTDMEEVVDDYAGMLRAELAGLPARVTRDLVLRRTIEQAINEILARVAGTLRQKADDLSPADGLDGAIADHAAGRVGRRKSDIRPGQGNTRPA